MYRDRAYYDREKRLLRGIEVTSGGCWEWQGARDPSGYGSIKRMGKKTNTHKASYEHHVGPVPEGLDLDHLCRNRICCNPEHLEPVTRSINAKRGLVGYGRRSDKEN